MLGWNWVWEIWVRFETEKERASKSASHKYHPGLTGFIKLPAGTETGLKSKLEIPNSTYTYRLSFSVQQL